MRNCAIIEQIKNKKIYFIAISESLCEDNTYGVIVFFLLI